MAYVNPAYIARQHGHANTKILFAVYAKWIDAAERGRGKAKMEARLRFHSSFAINNFHKINSESIPIYPSIPMTSRILVGTIGLEPTTPTMSR